MKCVLVALVSVCLLSGAVHGQEDKNFDIKKLLELYKTAKKGGFNFEKVNFDAIGAKLAAKGLDFTKLKMNNPELTRDLEEIEQLRLKYKLKQSSLSADVTNAIVPEDKALTKEQEEENLRRFKANLKRVAALQSKPKMNALQTQTSNLASLKPAVSNPIQRGLSGSHRLNPLALQHTRGSFIPHPQRNRYHMPIQRLHKPLGFGKVPAFGPHVTRANGYTYFFR